MTTAEVKIPTLSQKAREGWGTRARLLFVGAFFGNWLLSGVFLLPEDSGENLVYIFQLAWEVEGVFDLLARDFAGDLFVSQD